MASSRPTVRGLTTSSLVIGLSFAAVALGRPGELTSSSSDGQPPYRGAGMPVCDSSNTVVTESTDLDTLNGTVVCSGSAGTSDHYYGRSHDLSTLDAGGNEIVLECVKWGIYSNDLEVTATINIFSDDDGDPSGGMSLLGSLSDTIPVSSEPFFMTFTGDGSIVLPQGFIFVEMFIPGSSLSESHFVGGNNGGQSSPSWIRTADASCGIGAWTELDNIGWESVNWVEAIGID